MQTQQENKSLNWFKASKTQLGLDPLLEVMKQRQIPLTKENYLALDNPEDPNSAEVNEYLPPELKD